MNTHEIFRCVSITEHRPPKSLCLRMDLERNEMFLEFKMGRPSYCPVRTNRAPGGVK